MKRPIFMRSASPCSALLPASIPYGNLDATSKPRRDRPKPLGELRPDLPAWLQAVLARAIAADPTNRFRDMMEFAIEMEEGPERGVAWDQRYADALSTLSGANLAGHGRASCGRAACVALAAALIADGQHH